MKFRSEQESDILSLDHELPNSDKVSFFETIYLYGDIRGKQFWPAFDKIRSTEGFRIVFRHHSPTTVNNNEKINVPGYAIELAIKSTEYRAEDDRKAKRPPSLSLIPQRCRQP